MRASKARQPLALKKPTIITDISSLQRRRRPLHSFPSSCRTWPPYHRRLMGQDRQATHVVRSQATILNPNSMLAAPLRPSPTMPLRSRPQCHYILSICTMLKPKSRSLCYLGLLPRFRHRDRSPCAILSQWAPMTLCHEVGWWFILHLRPVHSRHLLAHYRYLRLHRTDLYPSAVLSYISHPSKAIATIDSTTIAAAAKSRVPYQQAPTVSSVLAPHSSVLA